MRRFYGKKVIILQKYYHSVTLKREQCMGCTNCIKRCPTEAIRVREGKARIIPERCIDCGECIRVCPYHAKVAVTDPLDSIHRFKYKIALPAPSLYGQFKNLKSIDSILQGLLGLGFDDVFEVARGADYITDFSKKLIQKWKGPWPLISSACPAIIRLIQVRFPELIENILPVESPMECAAQIAKQEFCRRHGVDEAQVGIFFITPCAAKMTSIRSPIGKEKSAVDGAISILEIYGPLAASMNKLESKPNIQKATLWGVGWANSGGESYAIGTDNYLAVNGIHNVIHVLEQIENGKLSDLEFFEGLACTGGCVGGPLVFENSFVAQTRIKKLVERMTEADKINKDLDPVYKNSDWTLKRKIYPNPVMKLDENLSVAIKKMEEMERIYKRLPGLDCGSCGSPSCRTLAEDIVQGNATELDCIFELRERVQELAREMIELSEKIPTGRERKKGDNQ